MAPLNLVDANLLIYATVDNFPQHESARAWLRAQFTGHARIGLPWQVLTAYVRIATNPRFVRPARPVRDVWEQVEAWLDHPLVWIPEPTGSHRTVLGRILRTGAVSGDLLSDAHLAALAMEHGLTVCSADSDFAKFPGVRWLNPLRARPPEAAEGSAPYGRRRRKT